MASKLQLSPFSIVQPILQPLLHYLLPAPCALCGAGGAGRICKACATQFFGHDRPRCGQCGNPLDGSGADRLVCGRCLADPPAFDATLVAGDYAAPLTELVLRLKFGGQLALAALFAQQLRDAVLRQGALYQAGFALPALLCPVPLGPGRLAERGFNQALEIARPLARMLGIALQPALAQRVRETQAQSLLAPGERGRNMAHAFTLAPQAMVLVRGCHIGIVDDVMSSGQTLCELAATFKRFGAARVTNLVFARTPPH